MNVAATAPTPVATDVLRGIAAAFDSLTPQMKRGARWLVDHSADVGLLSMREQARSAGVSAPTMLRLAQVLGFADFAELRRAFQHELAAGHARVKGVAPYRRRASALQAVEGSSRSSRLSGEIVRMQADDVLSVAMINSAAQIDAAVKAIARAPRVGFLGVRASFAIAFYFRYGYNLIATNGVLFDGLGGLLADQVESLGPGDVLVAVSQAPYSEPTVTAVGAAVRRGITVVALTDSELSPLARLATHTLLAHTETLSFFPSMVAPLALVEVLLAGLAARGGKKVLRRLAEVDGRLLVSRAYWTEPKADHVDPKPGKLPARRSAPRRTLQP